MNTRFGKYALAIFLRIVLICGMTATAHAQTPIALTLNGHKFTPDHVQVPANARFKITVTNRDTTPDEFESPDLRVEKIVVPGQTITVLAGPLRPGAYKFYDDYHPETANGIAEAR
jgi:heme/copper-type cytochrome/quinol oxidase subunit 2